MLASFFLWPVRVSLFAWLSRFAFACARRLLLLRSLPPRRALRSKKTSPLTDGLSTKHGAPQLLAPRLWLKCWVLLLRLPGEGGTPLTPGGLGRRRRQPPPGPGRTTTTPRRRPPPAKERTGPLARSARNWHVPARARGAQPARLAALNRRVLRRATGTSCGAQPARLAARNRRVPRRAERRVSRRAERRVSRRAERRVSRHATGASTDAQTT